MLFFEKLYNYYDPEVETKEEVLKETLTELEKAEGVITVADCGGAEFGKVRFSSACNCQNRCHGGFRTTVTEKDLEILTEEEYYAKKQG